MNSETIGETQFVEFGSCHDSSSHTSAMQGSYFFPLYLFMQIPYMLHHTDVCV